MTKYKVVAWRITASTGLKVLVQQKPVWHLENEPDMVEELCVKMGEGALITEDF